VSSKAGLQVLESEAEILGLEFEKSGQEVLGVVEATGTRLSPAKAFGIAQKLAKDVRSFLLKVADKGQPARKLYDATVRAMRAEQSACELMEQLTLHGIQMTSRDQRVILGGR
jgi:hypothetical protein